VVRGSLPSTVQLVLSTRTDPALALGTLRARGQLLELRADELRFTAAEANEFLNGRLELDLAAADVDLLVSRTDGWPAGVYLAALSLSGTADKHGLITAFDGTSAHVVDFLASEVLSAHEPGLQAEAARTMTANAGAQTFVLVLRGEIGDRPGVLFDGMRLERVRGTTVLTGPVRDQAHLHGLIGRIQELGIELGSVNPLDKRKDDR